MQYVNKEPIYIGFGAGLSGQWSQLGVQVRNGFLQAVEDINAEGGINGREVIPVIMDDKNDNAHTIELIGEMDKKDIQYFVGFTVSSMTPSIDQLMTTTELMVFSPTMSTNSLIGIDDRFLRVCNASSFEAESLLSLLSQDGRKDVAIVYDSSNQPYTQPIRNIIVGSAEVHGLNLVYDEEFNSKTIKYSDLVMRMLSKEPEQIVIVASGIDTAEIAQQIRKEGSDALLYASAWATTNDLLENGGRAVNGMRVNGLYDINSNNPKYLAFKSKMINAFGDDPTFPQIFGYESLQIIKEGIESADSYEVDAVKAAIISKGRFQGLQNDILIDEYGDAHRPYYGYIVEDGQFRSMK